VAYLGELDKSERRGWGRLALHLDGKAAGKARQLMLFDYADTDRDDPVPQYVEVDLKGIRIEQTRDFGDIFLALSLRRILSFDEFFGDTPKNELAFWRRFEEVSTAEAIFLSEIYRTRSRWELFERICCFWAVRIGPGAAEPRVARTAKNSPVHRTNRLQCNVWIYCFL
jgi:hypothetical protein